MKAAAASMECLFTAAQIEARVAELAADLSRDLRDVETPLFIGVLTGAWVFMADLVRRLETEVQCDFIRLASYKGGETGGQITLESAPRADCRGRHIVLIEDIIDTGLSLRWLRAHFTPQAASLRVCTLLDKPARRKTQAHADYTGFTIPDHFVVGYGMDYNERYRELPFIGVLPAREVSS
ncbi:MAG: hypoxanthine phosphoribosyltransferase [Gammaproteobacteria bacterium]|nr:hypoxanthine phosphoribosyltransferase [Gammaproteobacteria bacterium]